MFEITNKSINSYPGNEVTLNPKAGAVVTFEGRVRNHNLGLEVTSLEYECYEPMALKVGDKILQKSLEQFDIIQAYCVHRQGHLQIGDLAVWIHVSSKHRLEAYLASQYIIDEIKLKVPIWKREHYVDRRPEWVACHRCMESNKNNLSKEESLCERV